MEDIKVLTEKRNKLVVDAAALLQAKEVTSETRASATKMLDDADALEADINLSTRMAKFDAEQRATTKPNRGAIDHSNGKDTEVRDAVKKYIKYGERRMNPDEIRALATTTGSLGGYLIPQLFNADLIEAQKFIGNAVSLVNKKVTNNNGAPMKFALSNDTANQLVTITAGENTAVGEVDPTFSSFILGTDTVATQVQVSFQEIEDSAFDLDAWIKKEFALRYYRGLEGYVINGNGSQVASLASNAVVGATATGVYAANNNLNLASGQVGPQYQDLVSLYAALDPAYEGNASWLMNSHTRGYFLGQKDNYGRPFWNPNPATGAFDNILGRPVVLSQALPSAVNTSTTLTSTGVLYGDFNSGYTLRTDGGIEIRRSDDVMLQSLTTVFVAWARVGGAVTNAGTNPILSLQTPIA